MIRTTRPRIAYVTASDPLDRRSWSGIHHYMFRALQRHCGDVRAIGPLHSRTVGVARWLDRQSQRFLRKRYDQVHSTLVSRHLGHLIGRRVSRASFDVIFAPAASTEIAWLETDVPIVYLSDTTFALINDYYPEFSDVLRLSAWEANRIEARAIRKARAVVYATNWAARSALRDYAADFGKLFVVPFGANLDEVPGADTVLRKRRSAQCHLLFLATDWQRKGGPIAFDALAELDRLGVDAVLTICGCVPPSRFHHPRLTVIPFLDKNTEQDRRRLSELLHNSDFLLLPTRAECSGIVFCEANAFGLPAITTNTGGVSDVVLNGRNGVVLPLTARGVDYAHAIKDVWDAPDRYRGLARSSRMTFDRQLTWDSWGRTLSGVIRSVLA